MYIVNYTRIKTHSIYGYSLLTCLNKVEPASMDTNVELANTYEQR